MAGSVAIVKDERTYGVFVTATGQAKMAAAVVNGGKVHITAAGVGDGGGAYYEPDESQTALKGEVWRGPVAGVEINTKSPNMIDARVVIPGSVGGWTVREAGLFDEDGDLIVIANYPETAKAVIADGISATLEILLHVLFTNVDAVTFQVDPSMDTASVIIVPAMTIPNTGWTASGFVRYPYCVDAPCGVSLGFHFPVMALHLDSLDTAADCGLCPTIRAIDGAIRFWAQAVPDAPMTGALKLTRAGGNGGVGGDGGVSDHRALTGRDAANQHPISAIEELAESLAAKVETTAVSDIVAENMQEVSQQDVMDIWNEVNPV